jgi:hypothetical protein
MSHMGALFNSRPWSKLAPDYSHRLITAGYGTVGSTSYLGAALASDGSTGIAYMPTSRTVTADLTRISGTQVNAWWYQPSSGTATLIGAYANTGSRDFTPGSSGDWVLVLDDASRNFPAPGSEGGTAPKVPSPPTNIMVR